MSDYDFTTIGKYRILELVGEGAMGVVYRATDSVLNRTVAVKVMSDAIARQGELRDRFLREAQAAGSLQHPNVITIFDFGEVEHHLYIAMEYVEGADLEQVLATRQPLTLQAKLDLAIGVLNGLAYAHRGGIVHRDIKPANIRITAEGTPKIMDFGVAHLTSSDMTRTGMMVGTPSYMSPEQVTGAKVTPASDLFAFGAVLYELLTGTKPFDAPTMHGILFKIVSEEPPQLSRVLPGLPPALERIVKKALAKDVNDRYRSALDMANDLSAVRASLSGAPTAGTLSLRASVETAIAAAHQREAASAPTQIYRAALVSVATLAVAGVAVLIWSSTSARRSATVASDPASAATTAPPQSLSQQPQTQPAAIAPTAAPLAGTNVATGVAAGSVATTTPVRGAPTAAAAADRRAGRLPPREPVRYVVETLRIHPDSAAALARLAAAAANAPPAARPPSITGPAAAVATPVVAAPVQQPAQQPPQPATPAPALAVNPSAEIAAAVATYARAIESRDIAEVRRAYPGITEAQQRGFEQFFAAAHSLRVSFQLSGIDVAGGTSAEANLVGAYDYEADGKSQHQPVSFRATLRKDGGTWRLTSVR